jgi:hypothetical protein
MAKKLIPKEQFEHINSGYYYRGVVINTFTSLERNMEMILTNHFIVQEDATLETQFVFVILDRMTFESKRTSIKSLVDQKSIENNFIKTKNNSYPHGKLFDEIRQLQELRNNFAHHSIAIPNEETDHVIGLAGMRDKIDIVWYTRDEIDKINRRILKASEDLVILFN